VLGEDAVTLRGIKGQLSSRGKPQDKALVEQPRTNRSLQVVIWLQATEKEGQRNIGVNPFLINRMAPGGESQLAPEEEPVRGFPGLA